MIPTAAPPTTSGKAIAALVLAIASFVVCPLIPAIIALVLASQARREIDESYGAVAGEGLVSASRVVSIVNLALSVVLVPIVLLAIAIPTFLGAQERASDRAVQSDLRTALTAEKVYFTSAGTWTTDPAQLQAIEPGLRYQLGDVPFSDDVIYIVVEGERLGLAARSESGNCFYVMSSSTSSVTLYADDPACRRIQDQDYQPSWR